MKTTRVFKPLVALGLAIASTAFGQIPAPSQITAPALSISDGANTVVIDGAGTVHMSVPCNCSTAAVAVTPGQITWSGTIGAYTLASLQGSSKPVIVAPSLDLGIPGSLTSNAVSGTLTISWTDVNFTGMGPELINSTGALLPSGNVVYSTYVDSSNLPFGTGTPVASVSTSTVAATQASTTTLPTGKFSMTETEVITLPAGGLLVNDFSFDATPALNLNLNPMVGCVAIKATENTAIAPVTVTATGGTGGYVYTATGLPPGLSMSSGGVISGVPLFAGTFSYTITVKDSLGNTGTASGCSITVSPSNGGPVSCGDAATIGFWHNQNGQALIKALNGGPSSTALGNWLASNYPYLYGAHSSHNLTGKMNTSVASLFLTLFTSDKAQAQILGGALAAYVTNSVLAGTTAKQYGFNSSPTGTGAKTYNVGLNGSAIGLNNNQSYTVAELLWQVNLTAQNGTYNANAFNVIFSGINQTGDIIS